MSKTMLKERFEMHYRDRIEKFVNDIENLDASGIPEPHLPHWGSLYESAPLKIGIIGRDTRSWGDMNEFINAVRSNPLDALHRGRNEFDSLKFTGWTNNFGKTFWDTSMKILAGMYGINDWKRLKKREEETPLRSFFWANVNSVERFEVCPKANGVPWETWRQVKDSSERHLDSFRSILDIFKPNIIFLLNWDPGDHFIDFDIQWNDFGNHQADAIDEATQTHIIATAHPTWLNRNSLYEDAIAGIIQRANQRK